LIVKMNKVKSTKERKNIQLGIKRKSEMLNLLTFDFKLFAALIWVNASVNPGLPQAHI